MNRFWTWLFGVSGGDLVGAEGWSLRFTGMPENASVLLVLFAAFGALAWFTLRNYRREGVVSSRVKFAIAALRIAFLALLFLILLQPAAVVRFSRVQTGAVAVLVDDTLSMLWADRYPAGEETTALAGRLDVPDARLTGDARAPRTELVRRALAREGGLAGRLARDHELLLYRFGPKAGDRAAYVEPLAETAAPDAGGAAAVRAAVTNGLAKLESQGRHTDVGRAVRETLRRLEGRRVSAIVVVSDGRNTDSGEARLAGAAQMARQRNIPLYAVAVGDPTPPGNVALAQLLGPREARVGGRIAFRALVTHRSMPVGRARVRLAWSPVGKDEWRDTGVSAEVAVGEKAGPVADAGGAAGGGRAGALVEAALEIEAPPEGTYTFRARLDPMTEDSVATDNEASTTVRVSDRKTKVLLIAGGPSWEFQFLRNYLLTAKDHYAVTAWQQNADERFNQDASTGMKRTALPTDIRELVEYDVVILCDVRHLPGSVDERFVELLDRFVGKHQGGLCYLAGNKHSAKTLSERGGLATLVALLPVSLRRDDGRAGFGDEREGVTMDLTPDGLSHPMMRLSADESENPEQWRRLPNVYRRTRVERLKPLASALASVKAASREPGAEIEPLLAVQHYGRGRVVFAGFDGTWRWRLLDAGALYAAFWSGAMDFLGAGRIEKKRILITTASDVADAGTDLEVRIEAYNREMNPLEARALLLETRSLDSGQAVSQEIRQQRPGLYVGTIRAERAGAFELDVKSDAAGVSDWTPEDVATRRIQVRLPQAEFWRPESDPEALRSVCTARDGCVPLARMDSLADRIPPDRTVSVSETPHALWNTAFMLLLGGLLLLAEWVMRKWNNMM